MGGQATDWGAFVIERQPSPNVPQVIEQRIAAELDGARRNRCFSITDEPPFVALTLSTDCVKPIRALPLWQQPPRKPY